MSVQRHRGKPEHYEVFRDGTFLITRGMLVVTNACNGAGGRVGFEVNASRAGPLMLNVLSQRIYLHETTER